MVPPSHSCARTAQTHDEHAPAESLLKISQKTYRPTTTPWPAKTRSFNRALTLLVLAILIDLAGRL